jgi:hypothetical protein
VGVQEVTAFETPVSLLLAKIVANDGTTNSLNLESTWNEAYWTGLTANADYSKRPHLLKLVKDFGEEVADAERQSFTDGTSAVLRDGVVSYEMKFINTDKTLFQALKSFERKSRTTAYGLVFVDACGNIAGQKCGTKLNYVRIAQGSMEVKYINRKDDTVAHIVLSFELEIGKSNAYDVVTSDNIETSINSIEPLKDLELKAVVSTTTTNYTVDLVHRSANAMGIPAMGQDVLADWTVVNKTTNAAVALTSVAEDAVVDGRYLFVATVAQTNGNVLNFKYLSASFEADFDVTITI